MYELHILFDPEDQCIIGVYYTYDGVMCERAYSNLDGSALEFTMRFQHEDQDINRSACLDMFIKLTRSLECQSPVHCPSPLFPV